MAIDIQRPSPLPIASLAPNRDAGITLIAPSKTSTSPAKLLGSDRANRELRDKFKALMPGSYRMSTSWLCRRAGGLSRRTRVVNQVLAYLEANRDWLYQVVNEQTAAVRRANLKDIPGLAGLPRRSIPAIHSSSFSKKLKSH